MACHRDVLRKGAEAAAAPLFCPYSGLLWSVTASQWRTQKGYTTLSEPIARFAACGIGSIRESLAFFGEALAFCVSALAFVFQEIPIKGTLENPTCPPRLPSDSSPDNRSELDRTGRER